LDETPINLFYDGERDITRDIVGFGTLSWRMVVAACWQRWEISNYASFCRIWSFNCSWC